MANAYTTACLGVASAVRSLDAAITRYQALFATVLIVERGSGVWLRSYRPIAADGGVFDERERRRMLMIAPRGADDRRHNVMIVRSISTDDDDLLMTVNRDDAMHGDIGTVQDVRIEAARLLDDARRGGYRATLYVLDVSTAAPPRDASWLEGFVAQFGVMDAEGSNADVLVDVRRSFYAAFDALARGVDADQLPAWRDRVALDRDAPQLGWTASTPGGALDGALVLKLTLLAPRIIVDDERLFGGGGGDDDEASVMHARRYDALVALTLETALAYGFGDLSWIDAALSRINALDAQFELRDVALLTINRAAELYSALIN